MSAAKTLDVVLLSAGAKMPVLGHDGDLGYDLFALEETFLPAGKVVKVRTGIAVEAKLGDEPLGLTIEDRSSMADKGITKSGGIIDAGYRGEIKVMLTSTDDYTIEAGAKFSQMVPRPVLTGQPRQVSFFLETPRGAAGFGSTGS